MTMYTEEQIEGMKKIVVNKKIINFYYEKEGDYYVIVLKSGEEFSFKFMSDIVREKELLK